MSRLYAFPILRRVGCVFGKNSHLHYKNPTGYRIFLFTPIATLALFLFLLFTPIQYSETNTAKPDSDRSSREFNIFKHPVQNIFVLDERKAGCCGASADRKIFQPFNNPEYDSYKLTATYYSLLGGVETTLMLNNKGPEPILAVPTFYSMNGTRLDLAAITVPATYYLNMDMHQLLAGAGSEFQQGSFKIAYQGGQQQLGAQVRMTDSQNSLIWSEQLAYVSNAVSSRLENIWWLPDKGVDTYLVVSNTTYSTVNLTITVDGTTPQQSQPVQITLTSNRTRVLDIMNDLVGSQHGSLDTTGGISITHTGNPGAVMARMFAGKPSRGYSASIPFTDPNAAVSQKWHGNGFRLRNLDGEKLRPILAVRNTTDQTRQIHGRIPYMRHDSEMAFVHIPATQVGANSTANINLKRLIERANIPSSVTIAGIELEHNASAGTVISYVSSVSEDGSHVFQVPMFDPQKMPSSAGGFPWKADGDYRTIVYIKNDTDTTRKYTIHLIHDGGQYSMGVKQIKPGQTVEIDFRDMRDNQIPDSMGRVIPLNVEHGQIGWGVKGNENKVLSARSEQISLSEGLASTYSCANCCPNVTTDVYVLPEGIEVEVGGIMPLMGTEVEQNCYLQQFGPFATSVDDWTSYNTNIATVDWSGNVEGIDVGDTTVQGCIDRVIWYNWGGGHCESFPNQLCNQAPTQVEPPCAYPINFRQVGEGTDIGNGVLRFNYAWESNTGVLAHLSQCQIGEIVTYSGTNPYKPPSPPFANINGVPNPFIITFTAESGSGQDNHSPPGGSFVTPYSASSFMRHSIIGTHVPV